MPIAKHLKHFIDFNTSARVVMLCRGGSCRFNQHQVDRYIDAVRQVIYSAAENGEQNVAKLDTLIHEQLEYLNIALQNLPSEAEKPEPSPEEDSTQDSEADAEPAERRPRRSRGQPAKEITALSMVDKLEESRKPLRKILQEDCIRLGLLDSQRAGQIAARLAGRSREEAEAEIVAELRNNLHQQIRKYIRKHKGGPWKNPKQQEDLRLDIANTNSVHAVVTMTRHLLKERKTWERNLDKGIFRSLLSGKLKLK